MSSPSAPNRGQASVEAVGIVLLVALLFAAIAVVAPAGGVGGDIAAAIGGAFGREAGPGTEAAAERPLEQSWAERRELVDRFLAAPLEEFLAYRDSPARDPRLDYSTNECSAPLVGSTGASFDFTAACLRHDFGYRNYHRLGVFEQRKDSVDQRFRADMRDHCAARPEGEQRRCFAWAQVFYEAVKRFGALTGYGREGARPRLRRPSPRADAVRSGRVPRSPRRRRRARAR
jgi:hypothetical protein